LVLASWTAQAGVSAPLDSSSGSVLLSPALNVSLTAPNNPVQSGLFAFSGADQISLAAGNTYLMTSPEISGGSLNLDYAAIGGSSNPNAVTPDPASDSSAFTSGFAMNNVPPGQGLPVVTSNGASLPEPSSIALIGGGIALLGAIRRFKK